MLIKVCGMHEAENIRAVEALGIDMMGFIFFPKSKRVCAEVPTYLPKDCRKVGVFVNPTIDEVAEKCKAYGLHCIQLHGNETPAFIEEMDIAIPCRSIIKAISLNTPADLAQCKQYEGYVDYFLFETKCKGYGGSGQQFDWTILADYQGETPFLLTGGIGPDDAERILALRHPQFVGIDLNSRFETAPGLKDITLLESFIKTIRQ